MSILIVYESMFGATHTVAEEIATATRHLTPVTVASVQDLSPERLPHSELVILGAPTHSHGLSTPVSREKAALIDLVNDSGLQLEHEENPIGMREWLARAQFPAGSAFAVFDTRIRDPRLLVGSAAHHVARVLRSTGHPLVAPPESFFVMDNHRLEPGERGRAQAWGEFLARNGAPSRPTPGTPESQRDESET